MFERLQTDHLQAAMAQFEWDKKKVMSKKKGRERDEKGENEKKTEKGREGVKKKRACQSQMTGGCCCFEEGYLSCLLTPQDMT